MPNKKPRLRNQIKQIFTSEPKPASELPQTKPLEATTALAPEPVGWTWETDAKGCFVFCSAEVEAILGLTAGELVGQSVSSLTPDEAKPVQALFQTDRPIVDQTVRARHVNGSLVTIVLNAQPLHDAEDALSGFHGTAYMALAATPAVSPPTSAVPVAPPAPAPTQPAAPLQTKYADDVLSYTASSVGIFPLGDHLSPAMDAALHQNRSVRFDREAAPESVEGRPSLALPIRLKNEALGVMDFFDDNAEHVWSDDDQQLVEAVADQLALALENVRLFNETRAFLGKQTLLYEVTRAAALASDLKSALQSAAESLGRVMAGADIAILLVDRGAPTLRVRAAVGTPERFIDTVSIAIGEGIIGGVAQTKQARLVEDVRQIKDYIAWNPGIRSEVAVPLLSGDKTIGVLNVENPTAFAFDDSDLQLLTTLAGTLSAIIVNNNLLEEISQERERLSLLFEVSRELSSTLDVNAIFNTAMNLAPRLGAHYAYILVLGDTEGDADFRGTVPGLEHFGGNEARAFATAIAKQGLEQWVLKNQRTALVMDTRADERWYTAPEHEQNEPSRSVVSVPLRTQRGAARGVLAYTHRAPNSFSSEQLPLIESIATQVAVAMENARLYQRTNVQQRNATALARATQLMSSTLEETEILGILAGELVTAYDAQVVSIYKRDMENNAFQPHAAKLGEREPADQWPNFNTAYPVAERPDLSEVLTSNQGSVRHQATETGAPRSTVLQPVLSGTETTGVVEMIKAGEFGQDDLDLFQGMLTSAASALQSARLYELQRQTSERLAEADRLKSQFLANMSHELRTPLNSIIGFSRVILKGIDGPLTDLQVQDLTSIHSAGQHLLGLINDILDMAKIEAGKMELVFDEVDLRDIIKGVMSTAIGLVKEKPIMLREELESNLPPVRADTMRVRQVLLNLLSNASKFTEEGNITLRAIRFREPDPVTEKMATFIRLSVTDSGTGMSEDDLKKLFARFSQVDASATRKVGGTGLGLSICKHLVELHGGRIWVESTLNVGTTFHFTIQPAQPDPQDVEADAPTDATTPEVAMLTTTTTAAPSGKPRVVLAVDDDPNILNLYKRYLEPNGYKFVTAKSTEVLWRVVETQPYVILLDVLMPVKDGWEVLAELKQNDFTRDLPVVMCTLASDRERAFHMGATDYLHKPILEHDLLAALEKLKNYVPPQTVLVIDDRQEDLQMIRHALEHKNGFRIIEAKTGVAGLSLARAQRPKVILLDLLMPEMNGFEVLAELRRDPVTQMIPVVVVTGADLEPDDRRRLLQAGAILHKDKGVLDEDELFNDVKRALDPARSTLPTLG